ncbi:MAG TPA: hypothetical protein VMW38_09535, partial [Terriglobia bacterium]|nr:hypothetical protein [Terriglobia bacterium]
YVRIRVTNGRSAITLYIASLILLAIIPGILTATKEEMLLPPFCWLVVVAASGYRFSRLGILIPLALALFELTFVWPFAQNARAPVREAETISERVDLVTQFIRDPTSFPDTISSGDPSEEFGTGAPKVNIIRRFSVLKSIDMLIDADLKSGYTSIDRYLPVLVSFVPHALWPDRPEVITSNELGHKAGFPMADEDTETGIEIGSPALFFDLGGWLALGAYAVASFFLFFFITVRLIGKANSGIWSLVLLGTQAHQAVGQTPASLFATVFIFLEVFCFLVAILKAISYIGQTLISRPVSPGIERPR